MSEHIEDANALPWEGEDQLTEAKAAATQAGQQDPRGATKTPQAPLKAAPKVKRKRRFYCTEGKFVGNA